ncbi:hypothetical protein OKA05_18745 [Luteolibacter arcticus]|uniref:Uncharacterized protein n=1 Tax=Luteolibacter arcticus TaxID=1581411 RepID=A0ABT3GM57_9BACT|nr:hypothetical protein [Luteolibacter arcticus]MCW1924610.1 hypothetical protein [Luteolibacter arcticus]
MVCLYPLVAALYFGLLPELDAIEQPRQRGVIHFEKPRSETAATSRAESGDSAESPRGGRAGWSLDWLTQRYEDLMSWEHNPWKTGRTIFGSRYLDLLNSKDPRDQARALELRRLGEALFQRVLARYSELAVPDKNVPPERNGFLKWLDFSDRMDADPSRPGEPKSKSLGMPDALVKHLFGEAAWDGVAAKAWLDQEKALVDEIRAIGLMPDRSTAGIEVNRWGFISARLGKDASGALLMDARLAAEQGDPARALESIQAARGLADHFGQVETPSLLAATVQILLQLQVQAYALREVIPALPAGQFDPAAWERAVNPVVVAPAEFGRLMRGEWNVVSRDYVMPMLSDAGDPKYPADPEALIDFHASYFTRVLREYDNPSPAGWPSVSALPFPDNSHLSYESRQFTEMLFVGERAWSKGLQRSVSQTAMTQAAFAIMKGEPPPLDPVYGLPYGWDPATRTLSAPVHPAFEEDKFKPIVVPRR